MAIPILGWAGLGVLIVFHGRSSSEYLVVKILHPAEWAFKTKKEQ